MPLRASAVVCTVVALAGLGGCSDQHVSDPYAFCETLGALHQGRIDVDSDDPNEFVGHTASIAALLDVAPPEIADDLTRVHDMLATTRDTGGWATLLDFSAMQSPELAAAEGRIAEYTSAQCGIAYGDEGWEVDAAGEEWDKTRCPAWPRAGSPLMNNRFPYLIATAAANYFAATFWSVPFVPAPPGFIRVPRGGAVEFHGEYPYARYFAYHPNDYHTGNLATLVDHALEPDPGSENPWRGAMLEGAGRSYTARLRFDAAPDDATRRESNTAYVGRTQNGGFNPAVFLIYRIYAADQGALPPNSAGVPLPAVTVYDEDGEVTQHFDACDPYPPGSEAPRDSTRFPAFPVPDHRAVFRPGTLDTRPNWGLPVEVLANKNVLYVSSFYTRARGEIFVVRARKPRTPSITGRPPWSDENDIRLFTVCSYNFWNGRANACIIDESLPVDTGGDYTIVASDAEHRPENADTSHGVHWLDTGPFLDGQLTYRMLLSTDPLLQELRAAIDEGIASPEVVPFVPRTAFCSRAEFERGGWQNCFASWEAARAAG